MVLGVEVLTQQVSLQEEDLGQEETLQGDGGRFRSRSGLCRSHQEGEHQTGEVDEDCLVKMIYYILTNQLPLPSLPTLPTPLPIPTLPTLTMNFISGCCGRLVS